MFKANNKNTRTKSLADFTNCSIFEVEQVKTGLE